MCIRDSNKIEGIVADHWKSLELIKSSKKKFCLIHSKEINHPKGSSLNKRVLNVLNNIEKVIANSEFTKNLAIQCGVNENKIKFIAYMSENGTKLNRWDSYFESKDFGWNGVVNNLDFIEFIDSEFDILISYYRKNKLELNFATACSKAKFKIGISKRNENLNDFTIDISTSFTEIFAKELRKYLEGLNMIK